MVKKREQIPLLDLRPLYKTWAFALSSICIVLTWVIFSFFQSRLPPEVPLWYSLPSGTSQLAAKNNLILLPILSTITYFCLGALAMVYSPQIPVFRQLVLWITTLVQLLFLISLGNIINLVL